MPALLEAVNDAGRKQDRFDRKVVSHLPAFRRLCSHYAHSSIAYAGFERIIYCNEPCSGLCAASTAAANTSAVTASVQQSVQ